MSRTIYTVRAKPRSALERSKIARPYRLNSVTTRVKGLELLLLLVRARVIRASIRAIGLWLALGLGLGLKG